MLGGYVPGMKKKLTDQAMGGLPGGQRRRPPSNKDRRPPGIPKNA